MTPQEMLNRVDIILEDSKAGILSTATADGTPHMRWLTPLILKQRPGCIYAVTAPGSAKTIDIESSPKVEWMLQTRGLTEVVNLKGTVTAVDNPALKSEIFDILGPRLTVFWKANPEKEEFIVLETVIKEGTWFRPMKGIRERVKF
ncbi:PPOX class probable F420-dependent enzyme [Limihaloglobus sulfuriphilus]|uniref:PPOX class probable F420-dependent enzyme n=1 Tax=Limihaloglobus sulfuriphilus TaxID=1851148 RepID=A0A1Q2MB70_9BACT|nr:pyridoxamine 5'-phosphate oxidase family protein [Limihaloglobus sulfuriphilus]AQQ69778.1 PPOX class probable F420-dependent enzyme [Limihaloglobus sulfuriphilus]